MFVPSGVCVTCVRAPGLVPGAVGHPAPCHCASRVVLAGPAVPLSRLTVVRPCACCDEQVSAPVTTSSFTKTFVTYLVSCSLTSNPPRRRFSEFVWLRTLLISRYPGMYIPPLPEKRVMNLGDEFITVGVAAPPVSASLRWLVADPTCACVCWPLPEPDEWLERVLQGGDA